MNTLSRHMDVEDARRREPSPVPIVDARGFFLQEAV